MSRLKLFLFGPPRVVIDDCQVSLPRRKIVALLAYLAVTRKRHQRDTLSTMLWPESSQTAARGALRRELYTLTSTLGNAWFHISRESVAIKPDAPIWLDVAEFRSLLVTTSTHQHDSDAICTICVANLREAAALYTDDFLVGFSLADALEFDDWQRFEAESLRREFVGGLARLCQLQRELGEYEQAIGSARRWLVFDTLCEPAHRELMLLYALTGEDKAAIRQYEACVRALDQEFGVSPAAETIELYQSIRNRRIAAVHPGIKVPTATLETKGAAHEDALATRSSFQNGESTATPIAAQPSGELHPRAGQRILDPIPLIGRHDEWRQLQLAWDKACQEGVHCVVITGDAGIGKTRLAEEMEAWVREQGAHTAQVRAYAAQSELAYAAVVELLHTEALRVRLDKLSNVWLSHITRLLPDLLAMRPNLTPPDPTFDNWQRHQLFEALGNVLAAEPHSLLVVLDDLHWSDQETIDWLHFLLCSARHHDLQLTQRSPLLVVGTIRSGEANAGHPLHRLLWELRRHDRLTEIDLKPLDTDDVALLATHVAQQPLEPAFLTVLQQTSEGNPLFVVETTRSALEDGGQYRIRHTPPTPDFSDAALPALPPKVYAMLQTRLAQLSPQALEIAELAAAIGRFFSSDLLAAAIQLNGETLAAGLDELWERRIIREQGADAYDFSHDRIREVAYSQIGRARRRLLHRRIAEALENFAAHRLEHVSGEIASHFEQAGLIKRAIEAYARAAVTAQQIGAYHDGIALLMRVLTLLARLPDTLERQAQELAICLHLALLQRTAFGYAAAEHGQSLLRARILCQELNKQDSLHHVLMGLYTHFFARGAIAASQSIAEELLTVAEHTRNLMALEEAHHAMGSNLFARGEFAAAHDHFQRALTYYDSQRSQAHISQFGFDLGCFTRAFDTHLLWLLGQPEAAVQQMQETIAYARDLAHPYSLALVLAYGAMLHQFRREPDQVIRLAEEALAICTKHRITYYEVWCKILYAWAKGKQEDAIENLAAIQLGLERFHTTESGVRLPYYISLQAELYLYTDNYSATLAMLDRAEKIAVQSGESWWMAELQRLRGEALRKSGRPLAEVGTQFEKAVALAHRQHAKVLELRAGVSQSRFWQEQGIEPRAQQDLTELLHSFAEGQDSADLTDANTLLRSLGPL